MSAVATIMTEKYKRKSVPSHLEIRGFSRNGTGIEGFNSTDISQPIIPQEFNEAVQEAISRYDPDSDHSSPINTDLVAENPNWTNLTGNTTDRSSSYSTATYDEFDREASANVQRLFDEIDSQLHTERRDSAPLNITPQLYDECKDWSGAFPHLRIVGSPFIQLRDAEDRGFHLIESPDSSLHTNSTHSDDARSRRESSSSDADSTSTMLVEGSRLKAKSLSDSQSHTDHYKELEEEIIVQDGYYEDIIAIDNDTHEDVLDSLSFAANRRKKSSRYPPVTPNACAKNDVFNAMFDIIWSEVNKVMRILLQRYSEHFVLSHPMRIPAAEEIVSEHIKLPQIPTTRFEHGALPINQHLRHFTGSVLSRPSPSAVASPNTQPLKELLQISKMGMTERKTFIEESGTETPLGSLSVTHFKKSGPRNQSANARKTQNRRQLAPINDPHKESRVRTPNVDDVLRGTSITKAKRVSSPPALGNKTLPPIGGQTHEPFLNHPQEAIMRTNKKANRASSAINEKIIINETRPSTTHTIYPAGDGGYNQFNLGLTNNRSTTPLDRLKIRTDGNRGLLTNLGITGSSLIAGSSHLIDEEAEKYHDPLVTGPNNHQNWAPPHTPGAQYRKNNKLNSSFVR